MKVKLLSVVLMITILSGCSKLVRPNLPNTLNPNDIFNIYQIEDYKQDFKEYKNALKSNEILQASLIRDVMINRIRGDIEVNYREYEDTLFFERAGFNVASDFTELGLAFATTVTYGERAKTVLGAIITGIKGERLSVDKNYFREKTSEMIISKMQANRDKVKNRILDKMIKLQADKYTFEEAKIDLREYFHAGTLQTAIISIANESGKDATQAQERTEEIEIFRTATTEEVVSLKEIRTGFKTLYESWTKNENDKEKATILLNQAKKALIELEIKVPDDKDVFNTLNDQIKKVTAEKDRLGYLKKLSSAFHKAEIIK